MDLSTAPIRLYQLTSKERSVLQSDSRENLIYRNGLLQILADLENEKNVRGLSRLGVVGINREDWGDISIVNGVGWLCAEDLVKANEKEQNKRDRKLRLWKEIMDLTFGGSTLWYEVLNEKIKVHFWFGDVAYFAAINFMTSHLMNEDIQRLNDEIELKKHFAPMYEVIELHQNEIGNLFARVVEDEFSSYLEPIIEDYLNKAKSRVQQYIQRIPSDGTLRTSMNKVAQTQYKVTFQDSYLTPFREETDTKGS